MTVRTAFAGTIIAGDDVTATNNNKLPGGWIGYVEVTASTGSITTIQNIAGLSVSPTVGTSRRIRVHAHMPSWSNSGGDAAGELQIREGSTTLTLTRTFSGDPGVLGAKGFADAFVVLTPSAGAHTYHVSFTQVTGTGSATFGCDTDHPAFLLVEDMGPA